ncbi:MAG TPA: hypothetical protein VE999_03045 [Gemmataceae bacterium]|nr:hypothetical protein [Gemmataceae bacterium]
MSNLLIVGCPNIGSTLTGGGANEPVFDIEMGSSSGQRSAWYSPNLGCRLQGPQPLISHPLTSPGYKHAPVRA